MAESGSSSTSGAGSAGVHLCQKCGYSLVGLPVPGKCPECGWAYTQQDLDLQGVAAPSDFDELVPDRVASGCAATLVPRVIIFAIFGVAAYVFEHPAWMLWVVAVVVLVLIGHGIWRRSKGAG